MREPLRRGTPVSTPLGTGIVAYVRFSPPDYREPAAYSVVLDDRQNRPGYAGTIFGADDVRPRED